VAPDLYSAPIGEGDFANGGLPKPSIVKLAKLFTVHSSLVLSRMGSLKPAKTEAVIRQLRALFT
jgi:hypothetical protein